MRRFKKMAVRMARFTRNKRNQAILGIVTASSFINQVRAQDPGAGVQGLDTAEEKLRMYVEPVCDIIMVLGGIVGIVGAIRVFTKWQNGDQDVTKSLMGWLGSCIFLVVGAIVVKKIFGVG